MNNAFRALELVYVLDLPPDHEVIVREELLRNGVSENWIRTIDPAGEPRSVAAEHDSAVTGKRPATGKPPGTGKLSEAYWPAKPRTPKGGAERTRRRDGSRRRTVSAGNPEPALVTRPRHVRLLPSSVGLGTYGGGRYDVVMRRRAVPEGRETVWISMAAAAAAAAPPVRAVRAEEDRLQGGGGGENEATACRSDRGGDHGSVVTVARCRCFSAECDGYKEMLCRYFIDNGNNAVHGYIETWHRYPAAICVYKEIVGVLLKNEGAGDCERTGRDRVGQDVATDATVTAEGQAEATNGEACESSPSSDIPSAANEVDVHDVHNDGDDGGGENGNDSGSIAPSATPSQQVSAADRTGDVTTADLSHPRPVAVDDPSTPAPDRLAAAAASPASVRPTGASVRSCSRQVTATKLSFFGKLFRRHKWTAAKTQADTDRSMSLRESLRKQITLKQVFQEKLLNTVLQ